MSAPCVMHAEPVGWDCAPLWALMHLDHFGAVVDGWHDSREALIWAWVEGVE